ncbi:iron-sulfur cluster insertion protein ErpA [Candidatus Ishikawella capsulata]|nr:iron-sulfur cluster insertion protein ErpA [Candidatus Ishikawaella capsulata]
MFDNSSIKLKFTDIAADKIKKLISKENNFSLKLRIYISGGGCSGFQYGFLLDDKVNKDDVIIEKKGVALVVDPMSIQYLLGASIDYVENIKGSRFVVINPNAKSTCSCGSSFTI